MGILVYVAGSQLFSTFAAELILRFYCFSTMGTEPGFISFQLPAPGFNHRLQIILIFHRRGHPNIFGNLLFQLIQLNQNLCCLGKQNIPVSNMFLGRYFLQIIFKIQILDGG